jgi:hypothetical protein
VIAASVRKAIKSQGQHWSTTEWKDRKTNIGVNNRRESHLLAEVGVATKELKAGPEMAPQNRLAADMALSQCAGNQ